MNKGTYITLAGFFGLLGWSVASSSLAEPLSYSPDRWPSRWSSIVKQNQANVDKPAYGYGYDNSRGRQTGQENPWAHNGSTLFTVPASQRPWGEPPRKSRREQRAQYYRDQQRPARQRNTRYEPYAYGAGISPINPGMGLANPYPLSGLGAAYPYGMGVSPLLVPPLMASPLAYPYGAVPYGAYPYGGYPMGARGMNWPLGAW